MTEREGARERERERGSEGGRKGEREGEGRGEPEFKQHHGLHIEMSSFQMFNPENWAQNFDPLKSFEIRHDYGTRDPHFDTFRFCLTRPGGN